jgi:hypothetical protein
MNNNLNGILEAISNSAWNLAVKMAYDDNNHICRIQPVILLLEKPKIVNARIIYDEKEFSQVESLKKELDKLLFYSLYASHEYSILIAKREREKLCSLEEKPDSIKKLVDSYHINDLEAILNKLRSSIYSELYSKDLFIEAFPIMFKRNSVGKYLIPMINNSQKILVSYKIAQYLWEWEYRSKLEGYPGIYYAYLSAVCLDLLEAI